MRVADLSARFQPEQWPQVWEGIAAAGQMTTESVHRPPRREAASGSSS